MNTVKGPGFEVTIRSRTFPAALAQLIEAYDIHHWVELPTDLLVRMIMREVGTAQEIVTHALRYRR